MPNNYFGFKQFLIHQEHCAMKVCTDACLFGAWLAARMNGRYDESHYALDVGLGTGLLSLMLAQQSQVNIDGVEIDHPATQQAADNFRNSPWNNRLNIFHRSIQEYIPAHSYDLIFSNPPFYEHQLKSRNHKRNLALHSNELKLEELVSTASRLLKEEGHFAVLLPYLRTEEFMNKAAANGFFLHEIVAVKQTPRHDPFRSILLFSKKASAGTQHSTIIIRDGDVYSPDFVVLLRDYYLNL
jgi:tRNA1Val (adenine37-N6)-methyltransferase